MRHSTIVKPIDLPCRENRGKMLPVKPKWRRITGYGQGRNTEESWLGCMVARRDQAAQEALPESKGKGNCRADRKEDTRIETKGPDVRATKKGMSSVVKEGPRYSHEAISH